MNGIIPPTPQDPAPDPAPDPAAIRRPPLDDLARAVLATRPQHRRVDLAALKSRQGPRWRLPIRAEIALSAVKAGYGRREIARFLDISEATVSRMLS